MASPVSVTYQAGSQAAQRPSNTTLFMCVASSGTDNEIVSVGSENALVDTFGYAPGLQAVAMALRESKRPQYVMRVNDSVAATMSAVAYTRVNSSTGTVANNSSSPKDALDVILEWTKEGIVGVAEFKYSLDGGDNYSGIQVSAATLTLGSSGINLSLGDGGGPNTGFDVGDLVTFTTTAPGFANGDITAAFSAFQQTNYKVRRIHLIGATASNYATIRASIALLESAGKDVRVILESDDRAAGPEAIATWQSGVLTDYATEDDRVCVVGGWGEMTMPLKCGNDSLQLRRPHAWVIGARLCAIDLSEDPGWVKPGGAGALPYCVVLDATASNPTGLDIDGVLNTGFDGRGITTVGTYLEYPGSVFCLGAFTRTQTNNDLYRLAHAQTIDAIAEVIRPIGLSYINSNVATNADGTIADEDADAIEGVMNGAIISQFVNSRPARISEASDGVYASVDRTNNILEDEELIVAINVIMRGFIATVTVTISKRTA